MESIATNPKTKLVNMVTAKSFAILVHARPATSVSQLSVIAKKLRSLSPAKFLSVPNTAAIKIATESLIVEFIGASSLVMLAHVSLVKSQQYKTVFVHS